MTESKVIDDTQRGLSDNNREIVPTKRDELADYSLPGYELEYDLPKRYVLPLSEKEVTTRSGRKPISEIGIIGIQETTYSYRTKTDSYIPTLIESDIEPVYAEKKTKLSEEKPSKGQAVKLPERFSESERGLDNRGLKPPSKSTKKKLSSRLQSSQLQYGEITLKSNMQSSKEQIKSKLSPTEKQLTIQEVLKGKYDLRGEDFEIAKEIAEKLHEIGAGTEIVEIINFLSHGGLLSKIATGLSIIGNIMTPIFSAIEILNAPQTDQRQYGMRAVAYTITAWAFEQGIPEQSKTILDKLTTFYPQTASRYPSAWKDASNSAIKEIDRKAKHLGLSKQAYRMLLRLLGDDSPQKLCLQLLQAMEEKLDSDVERMGWKSQYQVPFPQ